MMSTVTINTFISDNNTMEVQDRSRVRKGDFLTFCNNVRFHYLRNGDLAIVQYPGKHSKILATIFLGAPNCFKL